MADFLDFDIRSLAYPRVQGRNLSFVLVKLIKHLNANVPLLGAPPDPRRKAQMVRQAALSRKDTDSERRKKCCGSSPSPTSDRHGVHQALSTSCSSLHLVPRHRLDRERLGDPWRTLTPTCARP